MELSINTLVYHRVEDFEKTFEENYEHAEGSTWNVLDYGQDPKMSKYKNKVNLISLSITEHFNRCKLRNFLIKECPSDYYVNLDADNYLGFGYINYLKECFKEHSRSLIYFSRLAYWPHVTGEEWGFAGKIATSRELLLESGGYDERMTGWGYEEEDLMYRIKSKKNVKTVEMGIGYLGWTQFIPNGSKRFMFQENKCEENVKISEEIREVDFLN